ncbi:ATP-binding protein [Streptomyces sp. NPDC088925]|uniref:ATP-binding protein n=1 Tax=Streptomyces sp. NPDC088925 TaxID=3365914 RepID=UPI00382C48BD
MSAVRRRGRPAAALRPAARYREALPRVEQFAEQARRVVESALTEWDLDALAADAGLVVTELFANAVRHARGSRVLVDVIRLEGRGVEVAVADKSRRPPAPREPGEDEEEGRGLLLVAAYAARWGTDPRPRGKRVWAEVRR